MFYTGQMILHFRLALTVALALVPSLAIAQAVSPPAGDGTLHVLRPLIHAEQDQAELCLEFDHPLDQTATGAVAAPVVALKFEKEGKTLPVTPKTYTIDDSELCLPGLDHRKNYHLSLTNLHSADGAQLEKPYSLSATIPARRSSLAILNAAATNGLIRWTDNDPVLRAVNVAAVHLELYRITDPAEMVQAWSQRLQVTLAPTEIATFAKSHGSLIWQGSQSLPVAADQRIEAKTTLSAEAGSLPPGLYLIVATSTDPLPAAEASDTAAAKDSASKLAPAAAAWLLRSDLHMRSLTANGTIYALASSGSPAAPAKDVRFIVFDRNQQILNERRSDANGIAALQLTPDKPATPAVVMGLTDSGNADFLDADQSQPLALLPPLIAVLKTAKAYYALGETVELTLIARDLHNAPLSVQPTLLRIERPDHSLYSAITVPAITNGETRLNFQSPAASGIWRLAWQRGDHQVIAELPLTVSSNALAPRFELGADRSLIDEDGDINLTVKSLDPARQPAGFIAGRLTSNWRIPDHIFSGWKDYYFGTAGSDSAPVDAGFFVTDRSGSAHLKLKLDPGHNAAGPSPLLAAHFIAQSAASEGVINQPELTVPLRPKDFIVGVRPLAENGRFAENSLARFDVVALDTDGKRRAADNLAWQIYQEGRSFDWKQNSGKWDYKPQSQERRIGGNAMSLTGDGNFKRIEFPVTSGAYRLDITDAKGGLRTRIEFSAGWGLAKADTTPPAPLALNAETNFLTAGAPNQLHFHLDEPTLITAVIADNQIRQVLHLAKPAGDNTLTVIPEAAWGDHVSIWISTGSGYDGNPDPASGQLILPVGAAAAALLAPQPPTPQVTVAPVAKAGSSEDASARLLHDLSSQTILPQHSWLSAQDKSKAHTESRTIFVGAAPLDDLPSLLATALTQPPFTTEELAAALTVMQLWHSQIVASELLTENDWAARAHSLILRLLARQQSDGGFAPLPGAVSTLDATAEALTVLAMPLAAGDAATKAPAVLAADWLHQQLDNTWFDEKDRPSRAGAYAALAASNQLDPASLRYFADTSADKTLSPLAAAQLAAAFVKSNDVNQANQWLGLARAGLQQPGGDTGRLIALLAANPLTALDELQPLLPQITNARPDIVELADLLTAIAGLQAKAGRWQMTTAKGPADFGGVAVAQWAAGTPPVLRNTGKPALYAIETQIVKADPANGPLESKLSALDGAAINSSQLVHNAVYVLTVDGAWPANTNQLVLPRATGSALRPLSCALQPPGNSDFLGWLRNLNLTTIQACEVSGNALNAAITRGNGTDWHVAWLVQAGDAGAYTLNAPQARALGGDAAAPVTGKAVKLKIR